ncbi:MAG TPA: serine hydrolase domain-containing protein [Roseiflexaceae bacterium]|nr:serine hydrolase domain-containing protein [Roseiflexaceae bacterium]
MPKSSRPLLIVGAAALLLLLMCSAPLLPPPAQIPVTLPATPLVFVELPTVTPAAGTGAQQAAPAAAPALQPDPTRAVSTPSPGEPLIVTPTPLDVRGLAIDAYMNSLVADQLFHGSILVARNGQIVISKGYGMADGDRNLANTAQTRFRLASLTKAFTATAILLLQERGRLSVNDSICAYLEDCPAIWQPITIHQLLNHTSGLANYTDSLDFETTEMLPTTPSELVARFRNLPLSSTPGTLYYYGNSGYVLLGLIIERVSGLSYGEFVEENIFGPLNMQHSGYDTSVGTIADGLAAGYNTFSQKSGFIDLSTLYAAGALYASVEDMYRWDQALYSNRILSQPARDQMFTPYLNEYGYGWKISRSAGRLIISHPGNMTGSSTFFARLPDDQVTVIVLSNMYWANTTGIGSRLIQLALE